MARANNIRIETDGQIARALLRPGTGTRRQLQARANLSRAFYLREYTKSAPSRAASIFEQKDQLSITDKAAFKTEIQGGEIIISVNAPGAEFAEVGNEPGPSDEKMRIRIKSSKVRKTKGKRGGTKFVLSDGTKVSRHQGKYYLFTNRVKPFTGYHLLRKSVETAFRSLGR